LGDQARQLVATAIANTQARAELAASRVRVVRSADEIRRRIERDLHDGQGAGPPFGGPGGGG
jgi:hypothetical protein